MQYLSSTDARNEFSKAIEMAQREPVTIQKQGRDVAVVLSARDYARIKKRNVERLLASMAALGREAAANGLTEEKLNEILEERKTERMAEKEDNA